MSNAEEWRDIPDWEGFYQVSNLGNVRSLTRTVTRSDGQLRTYQGRNLRPGTNRLGYPIVILRKPGKVITAKVHRLVLLAFVGTCPKGQEACHNNGDRGDARLENLRWDTHSNNMLDRRGHGTDHQARKTHCPKGHPYDEENTKVIPSRPTARYCRQCHRDRSENRWHTLKNKENTNV
ncbi:NUMOD4 motif-containing HNH endonuclease [Corynebacterium axilliensis]|uniref:NUMOD4 motif-containing HNH endonuclease n=1 Tax=Corynebacterium sp. YSMAA5_1_F9 TaxID=3383591 RepID=UPI0038D0DFF0